MSFYLLNCKNVYYVSVVAQESLHLNVCYTITLIIILILIGMIYKIKITV